jgi:DNA-binding NtrC family response regulator
LFGHEKGAFTGAHEARPGKLEMASRGTIFIDEIAELGISGQLKFHRFLDDGTYERLGGNKETLADVRVVAATHRDLGAMAKEGKFREDLYYRINVVCLHVPPLRERPEDIPPIAQELLEDLARKHGKPYLRWSPESLRSLSHLPWEGNIRALRNDIERMVIFARSEVVQFEEANSHRPASSASHRLHLRSGDLTCPERYRFHQAFIACRGNKSALSRMLNTSRSQVDRLLTRFGVP